MMVVLIVVVMMKRKKKRRKGSCCLPRRETFSKCLYELNLILTITLGGRYSLSSFLQMRKLRQRTINSHKVIYLESGSLTPQPKVVITSSSCFSDVSQVKLIKKAYNRVKSHKGEVRF